MNHLTLYAYEQDGELFVYRCPECGSTGEAGSRCGSHEPPLEVAGEGGPKRVPVRVPGVGEERRFTVEDLEGLLGDDECAAGAEALTHREATRGEIVEVRLEVRAALNHFLDHFTQQPDSDGNQQPLGGVVWCVRCGFVAGRRAEVDPFGSWRQSGCIDGGEHGPTQTVEEERLGESRAIRPHVTEGDSVQCDGVALAQVIADIERQINGRIDSGANNAYLHCLGLLKGLTQQSSGGQEGGVEEGALSRLEKAGEKLAVEARYPLAEITDGDPPEHRAWNDAQAEALKAWNEARNSLRPEAPPADNSTQPISDYKSGEGR